MPNIKCAKDGQKLHKFPDCFPANFDKGILPSDIEFVAYPAYRILKLGILDHDAFISTFEEYKKYPERRRSMKLLSASTYSTSVFSDINGAKNLLKIMCRHYPRPLIAKGTTEPECGPCKKEYNSSHIDWWIYKDKSPEKYFKVVEENV